MTCRGVGGDVLAAVWGGRLRGLGPAQPGLRLSGGAARKGERKACAALGPGPHNCSGPAEGSLESAADAGDGEGDARALAGDVGYGNAIGGLVQAIEASCSAVRAGVYVHGQAKF